MVSDQLFIILDFFCILQTNLAMATLSLKEMEKFLWEGREKVLPSWLSQFSFGRPFSLPSQRNFQVTYITNLYIRCGQSCFEFKKFLFLPPLNY